MNTTPVTPTSGFPVLDEAHAILREVVRNLTEADFTLPTPCEDWGVGQVVNHALLDQLHFAATVAGTDKPEGDPFHPDGIDGDWAVAVLDAALATTVAAFATVLPDTESVNIPLPPFTTTAQRAASAAALDAAIHAWDIARAVGADVDFSDGLASQLLDAAHLFVDPVREWGAYAPARAVDGSASTVRRLLAHVGRDSAWLPAKE